MVHPVDIPKPLKIVHHTWIMFNCQVHHLMEITLKVGWPGQFCRGWFSGRPSWSHTFYWKENNIRLRKKVEKHYIFFFQNRSGMKFFKKSSLTRWYLPQHEWWAPFPLSWHRRSLLAAGIKNFWERPKKRGVVSVWYRFVFVVRFPNRTSEYLKADWEPVNVIASLHCRCKYQHWTQVGKLTVSWS